MIMDIFLELVIFALAPRFKPQKNNPKMPVFLEGRQGKFIIYTD